MLPLPFLCRAKIPAKKHFRFQDSTIRNDGFQNRSKYVCLDIKRIFKIESPRAFHYELSPSQSAYADSSPKGGASKRSTFKCYNIVGAIHESLVIKNKNCMIAGSTPFDRLKADFRRISKQTGEKRLIFAFLGDFLWKKRKIKVFLGKIRKKYCILYIYLL